MFRPPRRNDVRLLLLMDVGGTMEPYYEPVSQLLTALHEERGLRDFQPYYFHNCVYDHLYTNARMLKKDAIPTGDVLRRLDSRWKALFVGDAAMHPAELMEAYGQHRPAPHLANPEHRLAASHRHALRPQRLAQPGRSGLLGSRHRARHPPPLPDVPPQCGWSDAGRADARRRAHLACARDGPRPLLRARTRRDEDHPISHVTLHRRGSNRGSRLASVPPRWHLPPLLTIGTRLVGIPPVAARGMLFLCLIASAGQAQEPRSGGTDLAARLSPAPAAMEYWDVTAVLQSGHRFAARFLITNEGPGTRTAAAIGHLLLPDGTLVQVAWGRTREAWTLSADGRRLKVASAVLDLGQRVIRVEVDSDKRGIKLGLEIEPAAAPVTINPLPGAYGIAALAPGAAHGTLWLRGMPAPVPLEGTLALTHTWMERSEVELVHRRAELFGRSGDVGLYLADLTLADGQHRGTLVVWRGADVRQRLDDPPVAFGDVLLAPQDPRYPVAQHWETRGAQARVQARLQREWLRWDLLDSVPQPFRFLLSFKAQPQRVWADADFDLTLAAGETPPAAAARGLGVGVVTFLRALPAP